MRKIVFGAAAFLLTAGLVPPAAAEKPQAPTKPWKNSTEFSLVSTNGNSRATTTSAKEDFVYETTRWRFNLFGNALGAKDSGDVTAEEYAAGEKVDFKLTAKDYLYERFKWESNRFAGIRHRYDANAGYGRTLVDVQKHKLLGEIGPGYINEERIDAPRNDFPSGRLYSKYEYRMTEKSSLSQSGEYIHNFDDRDGYRLNTETALTASVTSTVSMKTSFVWNRIAKPAPGAVKDDTKLMAGLLITY
jgi:putative salt-induced outer membrane protein YdiY